MTKQRKNLGCDAVTGEEKISLTLAGTLYTKDGVQRTTTGTRKNKNKKNKKKNKKDKENTTLTVLQSPLEFMVPRICEWIGCNEPGRLSLDVPLTWKTEKATARRRLDDKQNRSEERR